MKKRAHKQTAKTSKKSQKKAISKKPSKGSLKSKPALPSKKTKPKPSKSSISDKSPKKKIPFLPKIVARKTKDSKRKPLSKSPVTYGLEEKTASGKVRFRKIEMAPQLYSKKDLKALQSLYAKAARVQKTTKPKLAFSEVRIKNQYELTKTGRVKKTRIKAGPLKGKLVPVPKTKLVFTKPKKEDEWRQVLYKGGEKLHAIHRNLQKRNTYEYVKSEVLRETGMTSFKEVHSRFVGGVQLKGARLKGRTLTEALNKIQVPVSALYLNKHKVTLPKFAKDKAGNIHVTGNVKVTVGKDDKNIPFEVTVRYLSELPLMLGRNIRQKLADKGATYTSPKELAFIAAGAWKKLKTMRKGLRSKKAQNEMRRLTSPGFDPKSAKLGAALKNIASGKMKETDFPLSQASKAVIDLRIAFYADPTAKRKTRKKGTAKKRTQK